MSTLKAFTDVDATDVDATDVDVATQIHRWKWEKDISTNFSVASNRRYRVEFYDDTRFFFDERVFFVSTLGSVDIDREIYDGISRLFSNDSPIRVHKST